MLELCPSFLQALKGWNYKLLSAVIYQDLAFILGVELLDYVVDMGEICRSLVGGTKWGSNIQLVEE